MKSILQLRTIFGALTILICLMCFDRYKSSRKDYLIQGDYFQGGVKKLTSTLGTWRPIVFNVLDECIMSKCLKFAEIT